MAISLLLFRDDRLVHEYPLDKSSFSLGRLPDNDIVIDESSVSRQHAQISRRPTGQCVLRDLDSRNGTWVNGGQITPDAPHVLAHGDVITLGMAEVTLVFHDEAATRRMPVKGRGIVVDEAKHEVYVRGKPVQPPLTLHQYKLLLLLYHKAGQTCTRDEIVEAVWPQAKGGVNDEMIDALVKRLRQRLAEHGSEFIVTVPRHGFRLVEA